MSIASAFAAMPALASTEAVIAKTKHAVCVVFKVAENGTKKWQFFISSCQEPGFAPAGWSMYKNWLFLVGGKETF